MSKCDINYKDKVAWIALLIGDLSRKYSGLIIEHRKPKYLIVQVNICALARGWLIFIGMSDMSQQN